MTGSLKEWWCPEHTWHHFNQAGELWCVCMCACVRCAVFAIAHTYISTLWPLYPCLHIIILKVKGIWISNMHGVRLYQHWSYKDIVEQYYKMLYATQHIYVSYSMHKCTSCKPFRSACTSSPGAALYKIFIRVCTFALLAGVLGACIYLIYRVGRDQGTDSRVAYIH